MWWGIAWLGGWVAGHLPPYTCHRRTALSGSQQVPTEGRKRLAVAGMATRISDIRGWSPCRHHNIPAGPLLGTARSRRSPLSGRCCSREGRRRVRSGWCTDRRQAHRPTPHRPVVQGSRWHTLLVVPQAPRPARLGRRSVRVLAARAAVVVVVVAWQRAWPGRRPGRPSASPPRPHAPSASAPAPSGT